MLEARPRLTPLVVAALATLAACGSSSSDSPPAPLAPVPTAHHWTVPDGAGALTAPQLAGFQADTLYYNAHTPAHPGGEIRGQLDRGGTVKLAQLNGTQETPAVATSAFGAGMLAVDEVTGAVRGFVETSGLVGATAAHVHQSSGRGVPGAIVLPLVGGPELWVVPDDAPPLTTSVLAAFTAGQLYFNVHTTAHPGGEIRGQIDHLGTARLASMAGAQETPAVVTDAFGYGVLALDAGPSSVAGFIRTSGLVGATAAHVHQSSGRGVPGSIVIPLTGGPELWVVPDDAPPVTTSVAAAFPAGQLYYNAHTPAHPGGEIRGQLDHGGTLKLATLGGAQETPAVTTDAFGAGVLAVDAGPGSVAGFLHTFGLYAPSAAHVHLSTGRGVAGGIIVPLGP